MVAMITPLQAIADGRGRHIQRSSRRAEGGAIYSKSRTAALIASFLLLPGCDKLGPVGQQEGGAEIPVSSISERLAASDRTVCADAEVQETAIGALATAELLEEYKAVGGTIEFDAVSAKGSNPQLAEITCSAYLELRGSRFELTYAVRPAADDVDGYVVQASVPFPTTSLRVAYQLATERLKWKIYEAGGPEAAALDLSPHQRSLFEARVAATRKREQESSDASHVEAEPERNNSADAALDAATAASATDTVE